MKYQRTILFLLVSLLLFSCGSQQEQISIDGNLKVVATTTIVGDIVSEVGGDSINLSVLLPVGTDPHSFNPTPQDIAKVSEANIIFANGAGLEEFLDPLIESAGAENRVVHLSEKIELLDFVDPHKADEDEHEHGNGDPHVWTNPNNVTLWVDLIEQEISQLDSVNASIYAVNAKEYKTKLQELDTWIHQQVSFIPEKNRKIITDHLIFGYFASTYAFEQLGAIIPGYSTLSEPSAQDIADMEDSIRGVGVKAIFVGNTVNPNLAERVAEDTGIKLIPVYTGSLSQSDGDAPTYIDYMRYNTSAFVDALK